MTWFVYIMSCNDGSLYTGITTDLDRRLSQHNGLISGGAKYTRSRRPVTLMRYWDFENRSVAQKREIEIKKLSRSQKLALIEQ